MTTLWLLWTIVIYIVIIPIILLKASVDVTLEW